MSSNHGGAQPKCMRLNLPLSPETLEQLRYLAYTRAQERSAVIASLIAQAAQADGFGASTISATGQRPTPSPQP